MEGGHEKAIDLVNRKSLWNIIKNYGIPRKVVKVIADLYGSLKCAVIDRGETSDWLKIGTGVKQMHDVRIHIITGPG